jgi:hypothetical protein
LNIRDFCSFWEIEEYWVIASLADKLVNAAHWILGGSVVACLIAWEPIKQPL